MPFLKPALPSATFLFACMSVFAHVTLLTGGLWWVNRKSLFSFSGPAEFELVSIDAAYRSGVKSLAEREAQDRERKQALKSALEKEAIHAAAEMKQTREERRASDGSAGNAAENIGTHADIWQVYGSNVRQAILDRFRYPAASRALGEAGRVKIAFSILHDGSIVDVRVVAPSAYERLNEVAVLMVAQLGKVAPLPVSDLPKWDTEIAVDFVLN